MNVLLWTCVLVFAQVCASFKILVISPFPSRSHSILGDGYVDLLLKAGHQVTYVTAYPRNSSNPMLREIDVSENEKHFPFNNLDIKELLNKEAELNGASVFLPILQKIHMRTLKYSEIGELISNVDENFDLVIAEWMFNEMYAGLSAVFDCPLIWFSTMEPHFMILRIIDQPSSPAYTSSTGSFSIAPFTFRQRLEELYLQIFASIYSDWVGFYTDEELYNDLFGPAIAKRGRQLPPYAVARFSASLVLGNSHVSLGHAISLPQNYKPIAGYHIDPYVKPLPKNLQTIMDTSTNGVIYFSMGTILKSRDMPQVLKNDLIKMFSRLKQTVLWKFEEDFPNLPKNVHILKWAPQQSILSHPNCLLFITHGGLLSTTEAVHFGVPTIGIPVFGDQHINVQMAVHKGFTINVNLSYNMTKDLEQAISEILTNPRYRNKVKELSFIYHHRPVTPQAEIIHWVEHVINTKGAYHLRSPALDIPWYQIMYLDFVALLITALYIMIIILKKTISIFSKSKQVTKKKKN